MPNRRKSATPCMLPASENHDTSAAEQKDSETPADNELSEKELSENSESDDKSVQSQQDAADVSDDGDEKQNGDATPSEEEAEKENQCPDAKEYRCKYCAFTTLNLGDFKEHVDSSHPDVILNPLYLCVACNFKTKKFDFLTEHNEQEHPNDANFKFKKTRVDNQTVLEQTIDPNEELTGEKDDDTTTVTSTDSSPSANEEVRAVSINGTSPDSSLSANEEIRVDGSVSASEEICTVSVNGKSPDNSSSANEEIRAVSINGTVIIPDATALRDSSHVSPMLQRPPNFTCIPKIAVPLNTRKYNPTLDENVTLIASFNKFPYPTHAELSWLTAASKHPEEQIRVWFTTQRLKQGITWSPEEVEEARKKMFNGSVPASHSVFTVLPTSPVSKAMVHTTSVESPPNVLKRTVTTTTFGPEPKRPVMAVAPNPGEKGLMAPPPLLLKPTLDAKWANANVNANDFKRIPVPLIQPAQTLQKNKAVPNIPNNLKTRPFVSMPSMVFPESLTRPMIAPPPIFAPPFKNSILVPRANEKVPISLPNGTLPTSVPLIPPQIRRPAIIQSLRGNANTFPALDATQLKEQNGGEANKASYNGKWAEHLDDSKSDFQQKAQVLTQFPLLERMKGKTSEQLKVLEENFLRNSFPTHNDVETLASSTKLSPTEIDSWFSERRALRDNLEQALLNSMGTKRNGVNGHGVNGNSVNGNSINGHGANGHGVNGHGVNGHSLSTNGLGTNGLGTNGLGTNGLGTNGLALGEKALQDKVAAHAELPLRGSEELIGPRWPYVDDSANRWFDSDGKTGSMLPSTELIGPHYHDLTNGNNGRVQEAELNWFNKTLYNRLDLGSGAVFGRWMERRADLSEES